MAFEDTTGGLGGLGGFMSGLGDKLGSNDMLTALALMDAGSARVNRPPLAQTLGPIMALQAKQADQNRERTALSAVLQQMYKIPKAQADQLAASDKAAGFAVQGLQLQRNQDIINKAASGLDSLVGGGAAGQRSDASPASAPADLAPLFAAKEQEHGLPEGYLARTAGIESSFNPQAVSPTGAKGLFQFTGGTARQYGLDNPFDVAASTDAAARLAKDNAAALKAQLGRAPTAAELYLAHQQGADGAAALLSNPNAPAHLVVPPMNLAVNGGQPGMTAGEFANKWLGKFGDSGSRSAQADTAGDTTPPQVASNDPNFVPTPPVRPSFIGETPQGYDWKTATAPEAGTQVAQARLGNTASDAPQPGAMAALPQPEAAQSQARALAARDAQRAQQGQLGRMEALQKAAAIAKLGLAYEGAGVKGAADNLKPFTEFYLGLAKPTDTERDIIQEGGIPGTDDYKQRYRDRKSPTSLQEARVLNPTDQAAGLREKLQLENTKGEDAYSQKVGGGLGETVSKMYDQYAAAYDPATVNLKQMQVMKDLTQNPNLYIGAGGEAVNELKKRALAVGQFLGMGEDQLKDLRAGASAGEVMQKIARQYAAGTAQSQVGSRVTNFELDTILKSNPGMASTPQGAQLMLDLMMRNEQRKIDLSNAVVAYAENNDKKPTVSGMRKIAEEYDAKNPLVTDDVKARLKGIPNAGSAPAEEAGKTARPAAPQRGEIRDGYRFLGGDPANPKSWRKDQ